MKVPGGQAVARELGSGLRDTFEGFVSSTLVTLSADSSLHLPPELSELNVAFTRPGM